MNYFGLFGSFFLTALSLFAMRPMAARLGLVDFPGGRKTHEVPTPLIGGLGIYLGTLVITLFTPLVLHQYAALLGLSSLILAIGIMDDVTELKVSVRMGGHALVAFLMATVAGVRLESFGDILGLGTVALGILSVPLTLFATVGVVNAINMSDGLVLIALGFIGLTAAFAGDLALLGLVIIMACSIAAFLTMNFRLLWKKRAMVYLGDAGSTMLGFMVAWLLIDSSQGSDTIFPPVFALWFLAIPLMDTVYLLFTRPLNGRSPFSPGVDHIHHNLIRRGLDIKTTVLLLYAASITFGIIGLIGYVMQVQESFMFLAFLALFGFYVYVSRVLAKPH